MKSLSESYSETPSVGGSEPEVSSPLRRPKRRSAENASALWKVNSQSEAQQAANRNRTGRPSGIQELRPRKRSGGSKSSAAAWNLGDSASDSSKKQEQHYSLLNHFNKVVQPLSNAVKELTKSDRDALRKQLDVLDAKSKVANKRKHKAADEVSRETIKKRLKRFEEDCGNDLIGHLKFWIDQDKGERLPALLELLKAFGDVISQVNLQLLQGLSNVQAVALRSELGLTEKEYAVLRIWVPDFLPPRSQVQKEQDELRPEFTKIPDGYMVDDILGRIVVPELESYLDRESNIFESKRLLRFPGFSEACNSQDPVRPSSEAIRCEVKFGGDGFSIKDEVTGRLISHEQAALLPLLPDRNPNFRNNSRPIAKQTAPAVPGLKGHSGEDREHLQPIFELLNKVIKQSECLQVRDQIFALVWLLSADYKFLGIVFGLGPGSSSSKYFCMFCKTTLQERSSLVAHLACNRDFEEMKQKGAIWELVKEACTRPLTAEELVRKVEQEKQSLERNKGKPVREKVVEGEEDERLDGRPVAAVMSGLLGKKMTFADSKEWAQSMSYPPLVNIPNHQAVLEVFHAGINLVSKHYKTAEAILKKHNVDLDSILVGYGLKKDITGWEWEKSRVVRKNAPKWLVAAFQKAGVERPTVAPWLVGGQRSQTQQLLEDLLLN